MRRFIAPTFSLIVLAAALGCGGDGSSSDPTTTGGGGTDTTSKRAVAGPYTVAFSGTNDAATPSTYTGSGSASVASDGTITITDLPITTSGVTGTIARTLSLSVTTAGVVSGNATIAGKASALTGTAAYQSDGTYLATVTSTSGTPVVTETDKITLTANLPIGTFKGTNAGTDTQGATYSGTGTSTVGAAGALSANYTSIHKLSGVSISQSNTIASGKLATDGTFTGTLQLGTTNGTVSSAVTGTWTLSGTVLTLKFSYTSATYTGANGRPTVTETLTLTKA